VLLRGCDPIPRAREALLHLQSQRIPFILLTNGGGETEARRAWKMSGMLGVALHEHMFIQSHTPFSGFRRDKDKAVLVVGGEGNKCRLVAES
jgi:ribonucleotide monophosphatase NagD (HAD superfamily)